MYIHLGQDVVVRFSDIIGIFDMETSSVGKITRDYLYRAEREGRVVNVAEDLPKSYIVCRENGRNILYISQISTATLLRRSNSPFAAAGADPNETNASFGIGHDMIVRPERASERHGTDKYE